VFDKGNLRKLDFLFGKAGGTEHNINRSQTMLRQLERIGFSDTPENREYMTNYLDSVYRDPTNIVEVQAESRVVKESLLMGRRGGVKMQCVWQGEKLITIKLFGGE
jgi:hypothetical protein